MTVVDASVWISSISDDEINHSISAAWFTERLAASDPLVVLTLFIAEVVGAVSRRSGSAAIAGHLLDEILRHPTLEFVELDVDLAVRAAIIASRTRLPGADAVYVAAAEMLRAPLITWDHEQLERASTLIDVRQPTTGK